MKVGRLIGWVSLALIAILAMVAPAQAADPRGVRELERELGRGVDVVKRTETGAIRFVGTEAGKPIDLPARGGPRARARAFVASLAPELGLRRPAREIGAAGLAELRGGGESVRLRQRLDGRPVIGGELVVNLDENGDVLSLSGETTPRPELDTDPSVTESRADDVALAVTAREHEVEPASLSASAGSLEIYDSRLLGGPGLEIPQLVWRFEVTSDERPDIRQLVLVDARRGGVALSFNQIAEALNREVCDAENTAGDYPCAPANAARSEGEGPVADSAASTAAGDVNGAYDFASDTYDFYATEHGRDGLDDNGMTIVSTADYCSPDQACPFGNAFWDGRQMVYGDGYAGADDVVGHELTHGVTQFESNLYYYYQSGAINESFSDIWGEFVDLGNGVGSDTATDRWLLGEDLPGGAIRDMQDPTLGGSSNGDPDRMTDNARYWKQESDNGGVHINSGVGNKAAYLLVDGDTFNGEVVDGIGISKAADIYYRAQTTLLTSASDYLDLYNALYSACQQLVGTGGIGAGDCDQVRAATDAVEMNVNPPNAPTVTALPASCTANGEELLDLFSDDFETRVPGRYTTMVVAGSNQWTDAPGSVDYATSGDGLIDAYDAPGSHDSSLAMSSPVSVPAGAFLRFDHAFGFDDLSLTKYGGGVVEYSANGGSSWSDLGPRFSSGQGVGGYNGSISTGAGVPPGMSGRDAFVGESNGYGASRADLASLADRSLRFRFRVGTDADPFVGDQGWFIDNLRIYACEPRTAITGGTPAGSTRSDRTPSLTVTNSSASPGGFECSVDGGAYTSCGTAATTSTVTFGPLSHGSHTLRVRALGSRGTPDQTPSSRQVNVDIQVSGANLLGRRVQPQQPGRVAVVAKVDANEPATVALRARVRLNGTTYRLRNKTVQLDGSGRVARTLRPRRAPARRRLARAMARGRKLTAVVTASFVDSFGNGARRTRSITLRR